MRILTSIAVRYFGYDPWHAAGVAAIYALFCLVALVEVFGATPHLLGNNAFFIAFAVAGLVYFLVWKERKRLNVE